VRLEAFYDDGATLHGYVYHAPGVAPGQGESELPVREQIVNSSTEANLLASSTFRMANNPLSSAEIDIPYNRDVFEPAEMQIVDVNATSAQTPDGSTWTNKSVVVERVGVTHGVGTKAIILSVEGEVGTIAQSELMLST
jgi:hypothetical protein